MNVIILHRLDANTAALDAYVVRGEEIEIIFQLHDVNLQHCP